MRPGCIRQTVEAYPTCSLSRKAIRVSWGPCKKDDQSSKLDIKPSRYRLEPVWNMTRWPAHGDDSRTNQPSSSSLLLGAGRAAPGLSCVGSLTYPPLEKGLSEERVFRKEFDDGDDEVLTGMSAVDLVQPREFIDSRNEAEVMLEAQPELRSRLPRSA